MRFLFPPWTSPGTLALGAASQLAWAIATGQAAESSSVIIKRDCWGVPHIFAPTLADADVDGNIRYLRTGRVPVRPPGFNFKRPLPGDTSQAEWLGIHPMRDLVQVLNSPSGYLQNCNISPDDPGSPHFCDQAATLFSADRLKPTWFQPAELEGHVESTKVLHRP